jgi:hypothetical protein
MHTVGKRCWAFVFRLVDSNYWYLSRAIGFVLMKIDLRIFIVSSPSIEIQTLGPSALVVFQRSGVHFSIAYHTWPIQSSPRAPVVSSSTTTPSQWLPQRNQVGLFPIVCFPQVNASTVALPFYSQPAATSTSPPVQIWWPGSSLYSFALRGTARERSQLPSSGMDPTTNTLSPH